MWCEGKDPEPAGRPSPLVLVGFGFFCSNTPAPSNPSIQLVLLCCTLVGRKRAE